MYNAIPLSTSCFNTAIDVFDRHHDLFIKKGKQERGWKSTANIANMWWMCFVMVKDGMPQTLGSLFFFFFFFFCNDMLCESKEKVESNTRQREQREQEEKVKTTVFIK